MTEGKGKVTPVDVTRFLKGEEVSKWYTVPGTEAEIQIRKVKPVTQRKLTAQCTSSRMRRGSLIEKLDSQKLNRLMLDEAILGWKNIIGPDGKALECNLENKIGLDDGWPEFAALWLAVVGNEGRIEDAIQEAESKN